MMPYERFREALIRAAYRAFLLREPESAVLAIQRYDEIDPALEADILGILERVVASPEYKAPRYEIPAGREFPLDSWVLAEAESGVRQWLDLGDYGVSRICLSGNYEPAETAFLNEIISEGMTFVDVGANVGWFSLHAAQRVGPAGRVIAIEPRRSIYTHLAKSFAENGFLDRVDLHNVALGAAEGTGHIGWHPGPQNSGGVWSLTSDALVADYQGTDARIESTHVVTLDSLLDGRKVDVIKIDIEGAEPIAFSGAENVLAKSRPIILSELNMSNLPKISNVTAFEYLGLTRKRGFIAHLLTQSGLGAVASEANIEPELEVINVVFVPEERVGTFLFKNLTWNLD